MPSATGLSGKAFNLKMAALVQIFSLSYAGDVQWAHGKTAEGPRSSWTPPTTSAWSTWLMTRSTQGEGAPCRSWLGSPWREGRETEASDLERWSEIALSVTDLPTSSRYQYFYSELQYSIQWAVMWAAQSVNAFKSLNATIVVSMATQKSHMSKVLYKDQALEVNCTVPGNGICLQHLVLLWWFGMSTKRSSRPS